MTNATEQHESYQLQCMDIWSGNRSVENDLSTPGLELFVYSRPYLGAAQGGDVHYLSLCAGGSTTRMILADVAGHGDAVAETSQMLRDLMRRFMNHKSQTRLVRELNRKFTELTHVGRFATAVVATFLSPSDRMLICNAGHPQPLLFQADTNTWAFIGGNLAETPGAYNLPLGIDDATGYQQVNLKLKEGDLLLFYTDAITEAMNEEGKLLGEEGLLTFVREIESRDVRVLGHSLLEKVQGFGGNRPCNDDLTLMVVRYSRKSKRIPGVFERLNGYAKVLGIKPT